LEADAVGECIVVAALETGSLVAGVAVGVWTVYTRVDGGASYFGGVGALGTGNKAGR
jgi:hypothetical protein